MRRVALGVMVGLAVLVAISLTARIARHDQFTIDTVLLIEGTHQSIDCVKAGDFTRCGYDPATKRSTVWAFPALQYAPAAAFVALHVSNDTSRDLLIWLNLVAVVGAIAIVTQRAWQRGGTALGLLAVLAMATGMLVPYAGSSFGEPLVLFALVLACRLALVHRASVWLSLACAMATMGKETIFPIVALCVAGFILFAGGEQRVVRAKAAWAGGGIAAGVIVNTAFNVFRFGTWQNVQYLDQGRRPDLIEGGKNALSILVAPNAGILWFWFAAAAAAVALFAVLVCSRSLRERLGVAAVLAALAVGIVSAAFWWIPFGWYSWGPRLVLVPLAPVVFAALETWPTIASRRAWVAAIAVAVTCIVLIAPNIGFIFEPESSWMNQWLVTVAEHPECTAVDRRTVDGAAIHHSCVLRAAWRTDTMPLVDAVDEASSHDTVWYWSTWAGAVVLGGLAVGAVASTTRRRERTGPSER